MSKELNLKEAERKVFLASFDDGLVDLFLSSVFAMWAIAPFLSASLGDFGSTAIFVPLWAVVFLILYLVRTRIIKPRIGVVIYRVERKRKLSLFLVIMALLNVIFMILGLVAFSRPASPGWIAILPFSAMVLLSFTLAGYFLDTTRFYIYGFMLAVAPVIGNWLYQEFGVPHKGYPITFGLTAGLMFLVGMTKLIRLLRGNPLPSDEPILQD